VERRKPHVLSRNPYPNADVDSRGMNPSDEQARLGNPLLWGFLSTCLLGVLGYFGSLVGLWPLMWLPLLAPILAFAYMRLKYHNNAGFDRFLAGFAIYLTAFILLVFLLVAFAP
jgi:Flp pilus assembly protein TadB